MPAVSKVANQVLRQVFNDPPLGKLGDKAVQASSPSAPRNILSPSLTAPPQDVRNRQERRVGSVGSTESRTSEVLRGAMKTYSGQVGNVLGAIVSCEIDPNENSNNTLKAPGEQKLVAQLLGLHKIWLQGPLKTEYRQGGEVLKARAGLHLQQLSESQLLAIVKNGETWLSTDSALQDLASSDDYPSFSQSVGLIAAEAKEQLQKKAAEKVTNAQREFLAEVKVPESAQKPHLVAFAFQKLKGVATEAAGRLATAGIASKVEGTAIGLIKQSLNRDPLSDDEEYVVDGLRHVPIGDLADLASATSPVGQDLVWIDAYMVRELKARLGTSAAGIETAVQAGVTSKANSAANGFVKDAMGRLAASKPEELAKLLPKIPIKDLANLLAATSPSNQDMDKINHALGQELTSRLGKSAEMIKQAVDAGVTSERNHAANHLIKVAMAGLAKDNPPALKSLLAGMPINDLTNLLAVPLPGKDPDVKQVDSALEEAIQQGINAQADAFLERFLKEPERVDQGTKVGIGQFDRLGMPFAQLRDSSLVEEQQLLIPSALDKFLKEKVGADHDTFERFAKLFDAVKSSFASDIDAPASLLDALSGKRSPDVFLKSRTSVDRNTFDQLARAFKKLSTFSCDVDDVADALRLRSDASKVPKVPRADMATGIVKDAMARVAENNPEQLQRLLARIPADQLKGLITATSPSRPDTTKVDAALTNELANRFKWIEDILNTLTAEPIYTEAVGSKLPKVEVVDQKANTGERLIRLFGDPNRQACEPFLSKLSDSQLNELPYALADYFALVRNGLSHETLHRVGAIVANVKVDRAEQEKARKAIQQVIATAQTPGAQVKDILDALNHLFESHPNLHPVKYKNDWVKVFEEAIKPLDKSGKDRLKEFFAGQDVKDVVNFCSTASKDETVAQSTVLAQQLKAVLVALDTLTKAVGASSPESAAQSPRTNPTDATLSVFKAVFGIAFDRSTEKLSIVTAAKAPPPHQAPKPSVRPSMSNANDQPPELEEVPKPTPNTQTPTTPMPEDFQDLMTNPIYADHRKAFRDFCVERRAERNVDFWNAVEALRPADQDVKSRAERTYEQFISPNNNNRIELGSEDYELLERGYRESIDRGSSVLLVGGLRTMALKSMKTGLWPAFQTANKRATGPIPQREPPSVPENEKESPGAYNPTREEVPENAPLIQKGPIRSKDESSIRMSKPKTPPSKEPEKEPLIKKTGNDRTEKPSLLSSFLKRKKEPKLPAKFDDLLTYPKHALERRIFRNFCDKLYATENLDFWEAVDDLEKNRGAKFEEIQAAAKKIFDQFVPTDAPNEINVAGKTKELLIAKYQSAIEAANKEELVKAFKAAKMDILEVMRADTWSKLQRTKDLSELLPE